MNRIYRMDNNRAYDKDLASFRIYLDGRRPAIQRKN